MKTKYNRIRFFEEWLSASEIGHRHGLSTPTILRRYHVLGLRDHDLVAAPDREKPASPHRGERYLSNRLPTPLQARFRLRRAIAGVELALQRLASAKAMGERPRTIERLKLALVRAEQRRMYCSSMVETADELAKEKEDAA